jgi:valyl-tRNA synthetase
MIELPSRYTPQETEDKWYKEWEDKKLFAAKPALDKKPYTIVIPPPNVTGILHMGHALNNTIQDILIRYNRMKGSETLWMPGTDHAGIATQNVVERKLAKENKKRQDVGREKFVEEVWKWKEEYGSTIILQLKKLGASCDWDRTRFTMDDEYSRAVKEVFIRLFEKKLIYQGHRIINWCPRCQTALSDEEAPHHDLKGNLYFLKYPYKDNPDEFVIVATTRPETMLGDTAVAVNPKDKRYKKVIGKKLILPLVNREIEIIADAMVDTKFGTGAVKVTPAHDPNDYITGKKHNLEFINIFHPDARINENGGNYKDMDRFEAREVIIEDLKEQGFLEKIEPHDLSAGHCYRCHTIIEPYLSKQWFVRMQPLSIPAVAAVKENKIKFYPKRWTKVYLNWMENIQDWCISRQIWWGHRIPVYYCRACQDADKPGIQVARSQPASCPDCGSTNIEQDQDVLDTWFSSWLWPFATFGWPQNWHKGNDGKEHNVQEELKYFYPTAALVTAPEIIFFWVARMIMAGYEFMGDLPFKDVYIHGTVRDIEGRKMSKSLGNVIDPLEIIKEYGTDALRFSLISITSQGQDVYLSKERFEQGRNFANKMWNASRFVLMNLDAGVVKTDLCVFFKKEDLSLANRWILSRFYTTLKELEKYLTAYRFNEGANLLYGFFWHEFCDWYLEIIKPEIKNPQNQIVLFKILEKFLRVMHPYMPFITEDIWHYLNPAAGSIMLQPWPHIQSQIIDKKTEKKFNMAVNVITAIRNMRSELEIAPTQSVDAVIANTSKQSRELLESVSSTITYLARLNKLSIHDKQEHCSSSVTTVVADSHVSILLEGVIDIEKEKLKIETKITKTQADIKGKENMLANKAFVERAKKEVVENERVKLSQLKETLTKLQGVKNALK